MKFLIIDGNSILNRAFYGIKNLTNKSGQPTNAIYGFLNIFLKLLDDLKPKYVAIAFDVKAPTFRVKQYSSYKATRKPTPSELLSQLETIKEILILMGYRVIEKPGFEADDILGTLSQLTKTIDGLKCVIATGDKDSLQLIDENTTVKIMSTKFGSPVTTDYSKETILQKYNVLPVELIDVKALMGDSSDNIPGVAGVGEKTAIMLISKYHNIEEIYNNLDSIEEKITLKNKLLQSKDMAFLSKDLATICNCVPIETNIDFYKIIEPNKEELLKILSSLDMFSIIKRLGLNKQQTLDFDKNSQITFESLLEKKEFSKNINDNKNINSEIKEYLQDSVNKDIYILIDSNEKFTLMVGKVVFINLDKKNILELLFNSYNKNKFNIYTNNSKYFHKELICEFKKSIPVHFCTEIAGYLLDPNASNYNLDRLINLYCQSSMPENLIELMKLFSKLCSNLKDRINENKLSNLLYKIELPLSEALADMELVGFKLDQKGLILFGEELVYSIEKLQNKIFEIATFEFNINSPKQLSKVLFEDLKLPTGKKIKTGYSTNADVLEFLRDKHPIIDKILEYRLLVKLKNTYVDGLLKKVKNDNRLHSLFNQTETKTGRISSEQPNLQNIPIRTSVGSNLRRYFIAEEGHKLIDGDYSQIELRILAHLSNDKNMIEAFENDQDIHQKTASEIFNVPLKDVTKKMRSFSKAVNFGIIYGISSFSLSKDIGVSINEAKDYIDSYFKKFSGVKEYLEKTVLEAIDNGFVTTLFGRKRNIPELQSKNKNLKSFGERIAKNTPIQGSAADIIKLAMVNVYKNLEFENLKSKIILQVHDELIIESPLSEIDIVKNILKTQMQQVIKLKVPLKADIGVGDNWFDSH